MLIANCQYTEALPLWNETFQLVKQEREKTDKPDNYVHLNRARLHAEYCSLMFSQSNYGDVSPFNCFVNFDSILLDLLCYHCPFFLAL